MPVEIMSPSENFLKDALHWSGTKPAWAVAQGYARTAILTWHHGFYAVTCSRQRMTWYW